MLEKVNFNKQEKNRKGLTLELVIIFFLKLQQKNRPFHSGLAWKKKVVFLRSERVLHKRILLVFHFLLPNTLLALLDIFPFPTATYFPILSNYICDVALMQNWFDSNYLNCRVKGLYEKIL